MNQDRKNERISKYVVFKGKILYDTDWYKDEKFFTKDTPRAKWALVSKTLVPDSTGKNYLQQTEVIAEYIKNKAFKGGSLPSQYQDAIREYDGQKEAIATLLSSNWQEAAKRLAALKLNQMTRQTPAESLYDFLVYFQNKDQRLLENMYAWTSGLTSDGNLVYLGSFDSGGANVDVWGPDYSDSSIGVVLSR